MAVADTVDPDGWMVTFNDLMGRITGRFGRVEPRRTATAYVRGLLSDLERKNCWNLAEYAGLTGPQAMQRLPRTACWDADAVRDDVRGYVLEQLGQDGVLIVDETGFPKKGDPAGRAARRAWAAGAGGCPARRGADARRPGRGRLMSPAEMNTHAITVHLDRLLAERGMTLTELADRVGVTVVNLSILKNGRAMAVRFTTLTKLCEVLDCQPGDLLGYHPGEERCSSFKNPARSHTVESAASMAASLRGRGPALRGSFP